MSLSEEILRIVHAFSDRERRERVRDLARRVRELEEEVERLRK